MATQTADSHTNSRAWQVPVFFLGIASLAAVAIGKPLLVQWSPNNPDRLLVDARADLTATPPALDRAIEHSQHIIDRAESSPNLRGEAHYILGAALMKKAEVEPSERTALYQQARQHFEQADRLGVPDGDRNEMTIGLVKTWLATKADPELAIRALQRVADSCDDQFEAYGLLAEAARRKQPVDTSLLLEATRQQVARASASVEPGKLAIARMQLAESLLQAKNSREARIVLDRLVVDAPPEMLYPARQLLAKCHEEAQDWNSAAQTWARLRDDPKLPPNEKSRVLFALGQSLFQSQRLDEAASAWQSAAALGGMEAQAASLRLVELRCATDARAAVSALSNALAGIASANTYRNDLMPLDDLRALIERCGAQLRSRNEFESAIAIAKLYEKVASPDRALAVQAEAMAAWAADLAKNNQPATATMANAARQYLTAANAAQNQAEAANWLWHAADLAQKAPDNDLAIEALTRYVQLESVVGAERAAAEMHTLGTVYERAKNLDAARTAYQKCAAAPNQFRFKARYALARLDLADARLDLEASRNPKLDDAEKLQRELRARLKFDDAEKMLQDNLGELRQAAQPEPAVQELTVYGLADIAYERADYGMAEPRLRGAIQEYPQSANTIRARNQLALCIWRKAVEEFRSLSNEKISEDQRQRLQKQLIENLNQSAEQFALVDKAYSERPLESLSEAEQDCMYKAAFSVADVYCVAGRYQEGLARYEALVTRFAGTVYELHAIRQVWHTQFYYFKDDARALEQLARLRDAMDRLQDPVFDGRTEMHQRNYWIERVVEMGRTMNKS